MSDKKIKQQQLEDFGTMQRRLRNGMMRAVDLKNSTGDAKEHTLKRIAKQEKKRNL